ncbi:MAG: ATP-binding cassette domain-containing protein [Deltaproteobacteria bacterium]|nr:ATP-binding cassette domain-containing protein [Deltaproteobacteria bacterium]
MPGNPLVQLEQVIKTFPLRKGWFEKEKGNVHAVNGVDLEIFSGETLGLVGESGCGKSTLGSLILRLLKVDSGAIRLDGRDLTELNRKELFALRRQMQVIFQDPYASLNPRMTIGETLCEPLIIHRLGSKQDREARVDELLRLVGLSPDVGSRYPHEFSGGQRQRIGIARALALNPKLIIADEPVSSLDVSIRGEVLNLLMSLQERFGLTLLFISHDLTVVQHVSHRIAVMYLGKIMEIFPAREFGSARHPYTHALVSAIPIPKPEHQKKRIILQGDVPSPVHLPKGCVFHPRCPYAEPRCREEEPKLVSINGGHKVACHYIAKMPTVAEYFPGAST